MLTPDNMNPLNDTWTLNDMWTYIPLFDSGISLENTTKCYHTVSHMYLYSYLANYKISINYICSFWCYVDRQLRQGETALGDNAKDSRLNILLA